MKIKIPLFLNLLFFCKSLICQVGLYPEIEWQNAIGGTSNDWGHSCFEIDNGSFAVGGGAGSLNGDIIEPEKQQEMLYEWRQSKIVRVDKVGRNEPCPCGSGKKYKKCCGKN